MLTTATGPCLAGVAGWLSQSVVRVHGWVGVGGSIVPTARRRRTVHGKPAYPSQPHTQASTHATHLEGLDGAQALLDGLERRAGRVRGRQDLHGLAAKGRGRGRRRRGRPQLQPKAEEAQQQRGDEEPPPRHGAPVLGFRELGW